jgi:hypothetical protein
VAASTRPRPPPADPYDIGIAVTVVWDQNTALFTVIVHVAARLPCHNAATSV